MAVGLNDRLGNAFDSWGRVVARRPWTVLWSSVLVACLFGLGIVAMDFSNETTVLWAVRGQGWKDHKYLEGCCGRASSFMLAYCERVGGGSILDRSAMLEVLKVHAWITTTLQVTRAWI